MYGLLFLFKAPSWIQVHKVNVELADENIFYPLPSQLPPIQKLGINKHSSSKRLSLLACITVWMAMTHSDRNFYRANDGLFIFGNEFHFFPVSARIRNDSMNAEILRVSNLCYLYRSKGNYYLLKMQWYFLLNFLENTSMLDGKCIRECIKSAWTRQIVRCKVF